MIEHILIDININLYDYPQMDSRLREITHILLHSQYNQSHQDLLDQAHLLVVNPTYIQSLIRVMFQSHNTFLVCSKILIKALEDNTLIPFKSSSSRLQPEGDQRNNEMNQLINHYQCLYLKPLFEKFIEYWVEWEENLMTQKILVDLGSKFLNLILLRSVDFKNLSWFFDTSFPLAAQSSQSPMSSKENRRVIFGFQVLRGFIKGIVSTKSAYFSITSEDLQKMEDPTLRTIYQFSIKFFESYASMRNQYINTWGDLDNLVLYRILGVVNQLFKFQKNPQLQGFSQSYKASYPRFLTTMSDPNIFLQTTFLTKQLISTPQLNQNLLEIAAEMLEVIGRVIYYLILVSERNNEAEIIRISSILQQLFEGVNNYQEKVSMALLGIGCVVFEKSSKLIGKSIVNGSYNNTLSYATKCIMSCPMNPEQKSIPMAFRVVRSAEMRVDPNACPQSLQLTLMLLSRIATNPSETNSGFEPKQQLLNIIEWLKPVIQDISLTNYPPVLKFILSVDPTKIHASSLMLWLTCVSIILFNSKKSRELIVQEHVDCVRSYLLLITNYNKIQFLFFVHMMLRYFLAEIEEGVPTGLLWAKLKQKCGIDYFNTFLTQVLNRVFQVFMEPCRETVTYTLEILFEIYDCIQEQREKLAQGNVAKYFNIYKNFLMSANQSVFGQKQYYSRRYNLLRIMSLTELKQVDVMTYHPTKPLFAYRQFICSNIQSNQSVENFEMMMYDAAGLVSTLQSLESVLILLDYILDDLDVFYQKYVIPGNYSKPAMTALLKLFYSILTIRNLKLSCMLKFKIHKCVSLILPYYLSEGFSKKIYTLFKVYAQFNSSSPLEYFPPSPTKYSKGGLNEDVDNKIEDIFDSIVERYFGTIKRVKDIGVLLDHIGFNADYLYKWYLEAKRRGVEVGTRFTEVLNDQVEQLGDDNEASQKLARVIYREGLHRGMEQYKLIEAENRFVQQFNKDLFQSPPTQYLMI